MSKNIHSLLEKFFEGNCTAEEMSALRNYFDKNSYDEIEPFLLDEWNSPKTADLSREKKELVFQDLMKQVNFENQSSRFKLTTFLKYAAIFIGILSASIWFFKPTSDVLDSQEITIELEDGSIKTLDSQEDLVKHTDFTYKQGELLYTQGKNPSNEKLEFNTIHVPFGKSVTLVLSDGSKTIINAGSSLRYPKTFLEGKGREVYLEGEAYFEVASNPEEPFKVISNHIKTQVLGTKFNVSAYPKDRNENIVLLEGSVQVSTVELDQERILEPNEMAVFQKSKNSLHSAKTNAMNHIAWTKGIMLFRNEKFSTIQRKLERHYNIEINCKDKDLLEQSFTGRFRNESIEEVFKTFQRATPFNYNINDNKITINPKK